MEMHKTESSGASAQESPGADQLRSRAEERLRNEPKETAAVTREQMQAAIHELRVHQIELEMQNEHLRATQRELELTQERYAELYDYAPVGYLTLNEQGQILAANLAGVALLGVERTRLLTQCLGSFVVDEAQDQNAFYICWRKIFGSTTPQSCEVRLRPRRGSVFWARIEAVQAIEAGSLQICRLTLTDVTEQKKAEVALRENQRRQLQYENEERMRLAMEAGGLGAWDQDFRSGQIICSDRARVMLGFESGAPVTWEAFLARMAPEDRPGFLSEVEQSNTPHSAGRLDAVFRVALPMGAQRWMRFVAQTIFDPAVPGKAARRTGVLADITRQREAEEMLASRARQLEVLVRERTARLQEAVSELEHFSYTLAHDLRAPLRAIKGYSDLVLMQAVGLSLVLRQYLERSGSAAERMDQLITDALNYNKLVSQTFTLAPVDCGRLLRQLLDTYPQFHEAKVHIRLDGAFPAVLGNPALLTQCFSNLLGNALKFVPHGQTPAVRVFAQDLDYRIRLWFQDNGIGIAEEGRERIFHMFQRLNHNYEGTGIGLALVRKAVERMGGAVGFESQLGQGSRFWIELNRAGG
jgi:PAS domain S-box-containing protein